MIFYYFGLPSPGNPYLDSASRIPTPDRACDYCGEWIDFEDAGYGVALHPGNPMLVAHNNCFLVAMSMVGPFYEDEEAGSTRQQADAAVREYLGTVKSTLSVSCFT